MVHLALLPPELLILILAAKEAREVNSQEPILHADDYFHLACSCRRLHKLVKPLLWTTVRLRLEEMYRKRSRKDSIVELHDSLVRWPENAQLVRNVSVVCVSWYAYDWGSMKDVVKRKRRRGNIIPAQMNLYDVLNRVLRQLSAITSLSISFVQACGNARIFTWSLNLKKVFPCLRELELSGFALDDADIQAILLTQSLRRVRLGLIMHDFWSVPHPEQGHALSNVTSLHLLLHGSYYFHSSSRYSSSSSSSSGNEAVSYKTYTGILSICPAVTDLTLRIVPSKWLTPEDTPSFLQTLNCRLRMQKLSLLYLPPTTSAVHLAVDLSQWRTLTDLCISSPCLFDTFVDSSHRRGFHRLLPPSLRHLQIRFPYSCADDKPLAHGMLWWSGQMKHGQTPEVAASGYTWLEELAGACLPLESQQASLPSLKAVQLREEAPRVSLRPPLEVALVEFELPAELQATFRAAGVDVVVVVRDHCDDNGPR